MQFSITMRNSCFLCRLFTTFFPTLSLATQNGIKKGTSPDVEECGILRELQGNAQLSQFLYKSAGELIENLAKQLGATCMHLRMEVASSQAAMTVEESLYTPQILWPHTSSQQRAAPTRTQHSRRAFLNHRLLGGGVTGKDVRPEAATERYLPV